MAETHYTPGPWWFEEDCDELVIVGPRKGCIRNGKNPAWEMCKIDNSCMWDEGKTEFEDRANASLIAAAPGLYAALEDACTSLMIVSEQALDASKTDARWLGVYEKLQPHIKAGRSALSKARGETNG